MNVRDLFNFKAPSKATGKLYPLPNKTIRRILNVKAISFAFHWFQSSLTFSG
jgi:hypothetical protein